MQSVSAAQGNLTNSTASIFGLNGIWIAYCLSLCAMLVLKASYYFLFWRKKEIRALI